MIRIKVNATVKGDSAEVKSTGKISGDYKQLVYEVVDILEQIDSANSELLVEAFGIFLEEKIDNAKNNH